MDPATAFGLAASVIQFISFASSLTKETVEIYRSGSLQSIEQLSEITDSLREWTETLENKTKPPHLDTQLAVLLRGCRSVAEHMTKSIEKARIGPTKKPRVLQSISISAKKVWSDGQRRDLQNQLNDYRLEICTYLVSLLFMRSNEIELGRKLSGPDKDGFLGPQNLLKEILLDSHIPPSQKAEWQHTLERVYYEEMQQKVGGSIFPMARDWKKIDPSVLGEPDILVLDSLSFPNMLRRYDDIEEAHFRTFEWIFQKRSNILSDISSFAEWLYSEEKMYWITGKAGSGKSTMVKFIAADRRTQAKFNMLKPEKTHFSAHFFFWNPGANLQSSQEGMLRTLLHQCWTACPRLIRQVATRRWQFPHLFGEADEREWEWSELAECLQTFLELTRSSHQILFLIDGLDEFSGDHSRLISLIRKFSAWPHLKICVSSRPWVIFEDEYRQKPSLRMEELTRLDIQQYILNRFAENTGFTELEQAEPQYASQLITKLEERACGVFLWVVLVTKELLEGCSRGDKLAELEATLDSLPTDLELLFLKMLDVENTTRFQRAAPIIQLVQTIKTTRGLANDGLEDLTLLDLAFANEDKETIFQCPFASFSTVREEALASRMKRRVVESCKGLIELKGSSSLRRASVDYLHTTVMHFFLKEAIWQRVVAASPSDFNPSALWAQAFIMRLKTDPTPSAQDIRRCCYFISQAMATGYDSCGELFDELEHAHPATLATKAAAGERSLSLELDRVAKDFKDLHIFMSAGRAAKLNQNDQEHPEPMIQETAYSGYSLNGQEIALALVLLVCAYIIA